jgi:hypothetical protein
LDRRSSGDTHCVVAQNFSHDAKLLNSNQEGRPHVSAPLECEATDAVDNRRQCPRYDASLAIGVQAVDSRLAPVGDSFDAFTVDLSQSGARFFNSKPILSRHAVIDFVMADGQQVRLQSEIVRSRRVGAMFEIAVRFVRKLAQETT